MSARDEILNRLRKNARLGEQLPDAWQSRRNFADLGAQFAAALENAKGEVHRAESLETALVKLGQILDALSCGEIVVNREAPLDGIDFEARFPAVNWHRVGGEVDAWQEICSRVDAGITSAEAALAETGSLVIDSGPGKSRLVSLLPPVQLALVPESVLTFDIFTWQAQRAGEWPANRVLVSGPSKTADIEQTLVVGVHGPKRLIVILYQDSN